MNRVVYTSKVLSTAAAVPLSQQSLLRRMVAAPGRSSTHRFLSSSSSSSSSSTNQRVVILGSGWAGFNTALGMQRNVPLTVVSPKNHFLFTPLLASSAVGTLEFRCIQEPVRTILDPEHGKYIQAEATALNPDTKTLSCKTPYGHEFSSEYDKLLISVGVPTNVRAF